MYIRMENLKHINYKNGNIETKHLNNNKKPRISKGKK